MNQRALAAVLTVASALVAAALVSNVDGFSISPFLRFVLTVGQAGLTAAVMVLPSVFQQDQVPHG